MQRPLLYISTPTDDGAHIVHKPISIRTEQVSTNQPSIHNRLLASQLRFFLMQPKKMRNLHFKLKTGSEYIGELIEMKEPLVTIRVNGSEMDINGNDIERIKRIR